MSLSRREVAGLLAACAAYDNRKANDDTVLAWQHIAARERWTVHAALAAITAHYGRSREWIMPADITEHIRGQRNQPPAPAEVDKALPPAPPATREHIARVLSNVGRDLNWHDEHAPEESLEDRRRALEVKCPFCGSLPGEHCTRPTRHTGTGRTPTKRLHPSRFDAAKEAH